MALGRIAGSEIYIGPQVNYKSMVQLTDFSGLSWTKIGGWQSSGDLGAEQETVTQTLISGNASIYSKGVITFPIMENVFVPMLDDLGQIAFKAAQESCKPYAFKIEWGADCGEEKVVTISQAAPGVVTWTAHGLLAGTPVYFTTTGSLPTGLTPGTIYYVAATPSPATNTFSVAATPGGTAIATTTAGTGVHTGHSLVAGDTDFFYGFAMRGVKSGGDASATRLQNFPIQPISNTVEV